MALSMAGPAYVLPITSLYPAIAALLALVFLKEHVSLRAWGVLALCVIGAIAIGYTPPEGAGAACSILGSPSRSSRRSAGPPRACASPRVWTSSSPPWP